MISGNAAPVVLTFVPMVFARVNASRARRDAMVFARRRAPAMADGKTPLIALFFAARASARAIAVPVKPSARAAHRRLATARVNGSRARRVPSFAAMANAPVNALPAAKIAWARRPACVAQTPAGPTGQPVRSCALPAPAPELAHRGAVNAASARHNCAVPRVDGRTIATVRSCAPREDARVPAYPVASGKAGRLVPMYAAAEPAAEPVCPAKGVAAANRWRAVNQTARGARPRRARSCVRTARARLRLCRERANAAAPPRGCAIRRVSGRMNPAVPAAALPAGARAHARQ